MKKDITLYITNPAEYYTSKGYYGLHAMIKPCPDYHAPRDWVEVGTYTLDLKLEEKDLVQAALDRLDTAETEARDVLKSRLQSIESMRRDLLCLTC